jgi:hypothetical protein
MHGFWHRFFRLNAAFVCRWLEQLFPGDPVAMILLFHTQGGPTMPDSITVHDNETTLKSTGTPLDSEGVATTLDTPPDYSSSDETVAVVHPSDDGLSATYEIGTIGDAVITVGPIPGPPDADGNPTEIFGKGTIHVVPGNATTFALDFTTG